MRSTIASAVALGLTVSQVTAQVTKQCFGQNACYQLNIPQSSADSGSGDIFFQLSGPTGYQWIALGQGSSMTNSNIFVMYTSADGNNVTVSPRLGTGHREPEHDTSAQITLLEGSGVSNGVMTANIRCSNCDSWSGGSMDFSSDSASWIWAAKAGSALDSDDLSEGISQHDDMGSFDFDLTSARGGSDVNPFISDSNSNGAATGAATPTSCTSAPSSTLASPTASGNAASGADCPTSWPTEFSTAWPTARPTWAANCHPEGSGGQWPSGAPWQHNQKRDDSCDNGSARGGSGGSGGSGSAGEFNEAGIPFGGDYDKARTIFIAHGVMASLAFVLLFPIGGILIRVASFTGLIWVHAAIQALAYLIYIAAFGLGIYMATQIDKLNNHHPIIGIVLFIILLFQPLTGFLHHRLFKKYQHRTFWSYEHLGIGRIAIVLGIINGGLGLKLADNASTGQLAAYGVIAAIFGLAYIAAIVFGETKRRRQGSRPFDRVEKTGGSGSSSMEDGRLQQQQQQQQQYYR